jgi:CBS domain-containing protein
MGLSEFEDGFESGAHRPATELSEEQALGEAILAAHIRDLAPRPAVTVPESASIGEAIRLMLDHKIGAMLVVRDGKAVGIFTERDVLMRVAVSGIDRGKSVTEVMTKNPEVLGLDDGIAFALNRMIARGFRHIPIVDKGGTPVAVLSVREVVAHIVGLLPARVNNLAPEPGLAIPKHTDGG